MSKKVIITEEQMNSILSQMVSEELGGKKYTIDPEKVLIVKKYLDENFLKTSIDTLGEDGMPGQLGIVVMLGPSKNPIKQMYKDDVKELLIEKFKNMFLDKEERRKFLSKVMDDWYDDNIGLYGNLSVNCL